MDTTAVYGHMNPVRMRMPVFTGALGSTDIARKYWDSFAIGAAISGISRGRGRERVRDRPRGGVHQRRAGSPSSPEMERRIKLYKEWQEGFGDIIVQMNVEDANFGVAEYVVEKLGVETDRAEVGPGSQVHRRRDQDPRLRSSHGTAEARLHHHPQPVASPPCSRPTRAGVSRSSSATPGWASSTRTSSCAPSSTCAATLGVKRVTLKTGAYGYPELARAIKWSSKARVDLLTIDGSGGGTGMSPWRMMEEWGIPTFYLQSMAYECAKRLATRGEWTPDLAMGGGFSTEDHIFKVLAMGAPYFKAVCMGRAMMIPGFVGNNIEGLTRNGGRPRSVERTAHRRSRSSGRRPRRSS